MPDLFNRQPISTSSFAFLSAASFRASPELGVLMERKRIRWAASSVYGRCITELREIAEPILREVVEGYRAAIDVRGPGGTGGGRNRGTAARGDGRVDRRQPV